MSSRNWPRLKFSALFTLVLAILCASSQNASAVDDPKGRIPNTELITQDGKKVHFYDDLVKGRIVAIAFILWIKRRHARPATILMALRHCRS